MEPTNRKILEQSDVKPKACFFQFRGRGTAKGRERNRVALVFSQRWWGRKLLGFYREITPKLTDISYPALELSCFDWQLVYDQHELFLASVVVAYFSIISLI